MKIALGTDHAGYGFKEAMQGFLKVKGYHTLDLGTHDTEPCDYPDYAKRVCDAVNQKKADFGLLVCGTGLGMSMAANKVRGIRAALCHDLYTARLAREHNDANVLVLPGRMIALPLAQEITEVFFKTPFEGGRHIPRLAKVMALEDGSEPVQDLSDRG